MVGVGHLGRHHARWYRHIKESTLVGVYDTDREKSRRVAEEFGVKSFERMEDIVGEAEAVSVAVPTSAHAEVAEWFINAGLHCLIEKPIASTVAEGERIVKAAQAKNLVLAVGHIERFNPAVEALKSFEIKPRFIEAHRLAAFDPRGTDVAVVLDLMVHDIELSLHFIKSPVARLEASAVSVISDTADIANARITFENGAVANLTASRISLRPMRKLRIFQKSGYFSLDLAEKQADIYRLADETTATEVGMRIPLGKSGREILFNKAGAKDEDMLRRELTDFLHAIQNNRNPEVTGEEATEALRVANEIVRIGGNLAG